MPQNKENGISSPARNQQRRQFLARVASHKHHTMHHARAKHLPHLFQVQSRPIKDAYSVSSEVREEKESTSTTFNEHATPEDRLLKRIAVAASLFAIGLSIGLEVLGTGAPAVRIFSILLATFLSR